MKQKPEYLSLSAWVKAASARWEGDWVGYGAEVSEAWIYLQSGEEAAGESTSIYMTFWGKGPAY